METRDPGYRGKRCREEQLQLFSWLGQASPCSQDASPLAPGQATLPTTNLYGYDIRKEER